MVEKFLVLSPAAAAILEAKGYVAEETVNPFKNSHSAWLFDTTPELVVDAFTAYRSCGKNLPAYLYRKAEEFGIDTGDGGCEAD